MVLFCSFCSIVGTSDDVASTAGVVVLIHICSRSDAERFEEDLLAVFRHTQAPLLKPFQGKSFARGLGFTDFDPFQGGRRSYLFLKQEHNLISAAYVDVQQDCARLGLLNHVGEPLEACVSNLVYDLVLCAALEFLNTLGDVVLLEAPMRACCVEGRCSRLLTRAGIMRRQWPIQKAKGARSLYNHLFMVELDVGHKALHNFKLVSAIHGDVLSDLV